MDPVIYTVTTINLLGHTYGEPCRCVGWFVDLDTALECVTTNNGDLHEDSFNYAVIEEIKPGLYSYDRVEHWFEWKGSYQPCDKPDTLQHITGFAMG